MTVALRYVRSTQMFEMSFNVKPKKLTPNSKSDKLVKKFLLIARARVTTNPSQCAIVKSVNEYSCRASGKVLLAGKVVFSRLQ